MARRAAPEAITMTQWLLRCESCGNVRKVDLGYNLYEIKHLYLYCRSCGRNTFHEVLGHE
ncbi:MAG: hypothetical protein DRJ41_04780 [Thermoprotei archaeon]|nr:MAG: hypothetical protein DRJ41_04780 [Thermoprotei archaeon]